MKMLGYLDRTRPDDETREKRRQVGVTLRRWVLVAGAAALLLAVGYDVWTTYENSQDIVALRAYANNLSAQEAHIEHLTNEVKTAEADHGTTLGEIDSLQKQVASVIDALPAADSYLGKLAVGLEGQIQSLCNRVGATCSNLGSLLPTTSSTATSAPTSHVTTTPTTAPAVTPPATTTTTTTAPRHGPGHGKGHR